MPNVTTFLNEGAAIPAGSAVTDLTTETSLPPILTSSATTGVNMANDLLNRDYVAPPMPSVAGATTNQTNAFHGVGDAANAYVPGLSAATGATAGVMNAPGALSVAQPYLTNAGASTVSGIDQYMNPYINAVVDRIGQLGQRNLTDVLMPAVEGRYIGAGQLNFGGRGGMGTPSGMMTDTARAIRDTNADILGKQAEELRTGYNTATGLSAADLQRQLDIGKTSADIYGSDATRKLASANQLSALAEAAQSLGLTGVNAMYNLGEKERAITNENYKAAYDEWMRQYNEPTERLKTFSDILNGLRTNLPTGSRQSGISPSGVQQQNKPGTAATIASGLVGLAGILADDDIGTVLKKLGLT
jgi:DNA-binding CsgD family transcriptional regulator